MNRTILSATTVVLAASILCADRSLALVGADLADRTIERYTVVVGSAKGRCTGVVLAQDIVLTAAHCIPPGEKFWVGGNAGGAFQTLPTSQLSGNAGGAFQTLPTSQLSAVEEAVPHPLFSRK